MHKTKWVWMLVLALIVMPSFAQETLNGDAVVAFLEGYAEDIGTGMVVFVDDNGTIASGAYGIADETGTPIETDDLFRIGSTTKPMVAVAVLMLAEEGDIELDAPIADYLPADLIAGIENADVATVRQVLQMTSGIYSYTESDEFDEAVMGDPMYPWTARDILPAAQGQPAYFPAGEDYYYSNTNYLLAEILIEEVAGISLAEALSEWIFVPAEMTSCYVETPDVFAQNMVRGYMLDDDGTLLDITEVNDGVGLGDGGVVCNAEDLAKFLPALTNGELLGQDMLIQMLTTVEDGDGGNYGLGIGYDETDFGMVISHDGATSGFQSTMQYLPDEGISIVVLTNNFDSEIVADVAEDALILLFEG
jgi:D-alanyl-D-alanine carboxypeptidase